MRKQHQHADAMELPANLRFKLPAYQWDVDHPGAVGSLRSGTPGGGRQTREAKTAPGFHTYLLEPRDQTAGAYVSVVNCRCQKEINPDGIRQHINTEATRIIGTKVTTVVAAEAFKVVEAERGEDYLSVAAPAARGVYFMKGAVAAVAAGGRV